MELVPDLQLTSDTQPHRQDWSDPLRPSLYLPDVPWDPSHPPAITSYFDGPHFSFDHTSAFNHSIPVTPELYHTLLTGVDFTSEINIGRNISFYQCA